MMPERLNTPDTQIDVLPALKPKEFDLFRTLIRERCGIKVTDNKLVLLQNRIGKRLRVLGYPSFMEYYNYATTSDGERKELIHLWSAITTNVTHFFRENHHFEALTSTILPRLVSENRLGRTIRVWSAGCSTGQEPYTLAAVLLDFIKSKPGWKVSVAATDIDINALEVARQACYPLEFKNEIPAKYLLSYFETDKTKQTLTVKPQVRDLVSFRQKNLREPEPRAMKYDLIFCRNVIMYFDKDFRKDLVGTFKRSLTDDGYLFLGSTESLHGMPRLFAIEKIDKTLVYRKVVGEDV